MIGEKYEKSLIIFSCVINAAVLDNAAHLCERCTGQ